MSNQHNYHKSTAGLIIAAAEKSGLLADVAEALCFAAKHPGAVECAACMILEKLADEFDAHVVTASCAIEDLYGEGVGIGSFTDADLAPYLNAQTNKDGLAP
jgi:hypothetical protein